MDFANAMKEESKFTRTENGAVALNTTTLMRYGIYLTNNGKKIHGQPKNRKVAGRKGVRKYR